MTASFFFYDLETSGFNPYEARIMQFAGQRTDLDLKPIGEPVNVLIKMTDEILPDPDAILVTGITPQQTHADGLTEAEFLRYFTDEIATPGTIFVGYNTVRFDDEFMRCLHYRNFYDPYEWFWQDGRSRWDLLDLVRMTRALRPDGIQWPFAPDGRATNRLEFLTAVNNLEHSNAHDALSDVRATIDVARMIRSKQQKLFDYLLDMRDKKKVAELAAKGEPFVYTSGKYPGEFEKTTLVAPLCEHPQKHGMLVYDLRYDPAQYENMTADQLADVWRWKKDSDEPRLPIKVLQYNRCPAIAPMSVLGDACLTRIKMDMPTVKKHQAKIKQMGKWDERLCQAIDILEKQRQTTFFNDKKEVDGKMYDGFFNGADKHPMSVVRAARAEELSDLGLRFQDGRLNELLPLYKARNFRKHLSDEEREAWERFRTRRLLEGGQNSRMAKFLNRLQELSARTDLTKEQKFLLEDLKLYAESIMPEVD